MELYFTAIIIKIIPKAIIMHTFIKFQAWAKFSVNFLYPAKTPLKIKKCGGQTMAK